MSASLLIDNSAWAHFTIGSMPADRAGEIAEMFARGLLFACTPFLLEAGFSARDAAQHERIMRRLEAMPQAPIDPVVEDKARAAQAELARAGHHRVSPIDLLIAAIADREGIGVLHYDKDYDIISEKTGLTFKSVWLAERGSL